MRKCMLASGRESDKKEGEMVLEGQGETLGKSVALKDTSLEGRAMHYVKNDEDDDRFYTKGDSRE